MRGAAGVSRAAGLFLDLDGTLADSLPALRGAYAAFLARFAKPPSAAEFDRLNGPPLEQVVAALARTHRLPPDAAGLLAIYRHAIQAAYGSVAPAAGAERLLTTAKRLGRRTGVVTSNDKTEARSWLSRVDLLGLVDTIVAGDEVGRGKPDPEPYLLALARTGCRAEASLAVEDSLAGASASLAANIPTLVLPNGRVPAGATRIATLDDVTERLARAGQRVRGGW